MKSKHHLHILLDETKLTSCVIDLCSREDTIVVYKYLKLIAMSIEPVDHVATIAGTKSSYTITVEIVEFIQNIIKTGFEIMERMRAPVVTDGICESLSVTGGSVEVDGNNSITCTSIDLRIPTSRPFMMIRLYPPFPLLKLTSYHPRLPEVHHGSRRQQGISYPLQIVQV